MGIAHTLQEFLDESGVEYRLVHHDYTRTSRDAAQAARIPEEQLAKPVLLEDEGGYLMAIVPASRRVELGRLEQQTGRRLTLATERELRDMFSDCRKGAMPAVGQAYGVEVIWDDCLASAAEVYFEAGDHTDLVKMSGKEFTFLMATTPHGHISRPAARNH